MEVFNALLKRLASRVVGDERVWIRQGLTGKYILVADDFFSFHARVKRRFPYWREFAKIVDRRCEIDGRVCPAFSTPGKLLRWLASLERGRVVDAALFDLLDRLSGRCEE